MHQDMNRRQFLQASGLGLGGLLIAGCARGAAESGASAAGATTGATSVATSGAMVTRTAGGADPRVAHIGVQLYTVRELMKADMAGTLAAIAGIGYREVEFAGYFDHDPKDVRAMLDRLSLTAPSAHIPLESFRANVGGVLDAATTIGHRYAICPYAKLATLDEWKRLADEFNKFGAACANRGVQFAYHNHDHEFAVVDGRMPYDVLLENTDPKLVQYEMDLFWTVKAGQDPIAYFDRQPGRFPAVHVKDMRGLKGPQAMVAVGEGDIDFRRIFARADRAGIQHYIVEHDNPTDAMASVRTSYGNLRKMLA